MGDRNGIEAQKYRWALADVAASDGERHDEMETP